MSNFLAKDFKLSENLKYFETVLLEIKCQIRT